MDDLDPTANSTPTPNEAPTPNGGAEPAARRRAGLLLHPTCLPGPHGIGDLGAEAEVFLRWLAAAGLRIWQVLPLGPPAYRGTPYGCLSAFAGNPALISLERLVEDGLLDASDLAAIPAQSAGKVDFDKAEAFKATWLRRAFARFRALGEGPLHNELEAWVADPAQVPWLESWALFATLKARHGGRPFFDWPQVYAQRDPEALARAREEWAEDLVYHRFVQWLFDRQWQRLRGLARELGIEIMGDLPIYIAGDSADVWSQPELFDLDERRFPRHVAGVPPDYFSQDGQLWGNPLYRWEQMAADGYQWWIDRLRANLRLADSIRLDHFRGFADYWEVPVGEKTAVNGRWLPGPGAALFHALRAALGDLPLVAEDLGDITPNVDLLRREFNLPGMRVLQFGFGEKADVHTPHNLERDAVVYTGTHDNNTAVGWYRSLTLAERERFHLYTGSTPREVHWTLIRVALASQAQIALFPAQDVLGLGQQARMNTPGKAEGNWAWRLKSGELTADHAARLHKLIQVTARA